MNELRYAIRSLRKAPGFTALAIAILGLGLGANITIFTLANTLLLRPPPGIGQPEELVRVSRRTDNTVAGSLSYPDYEFYREQARTLSGLAAYASGTGTVLANTGSDAIEVRSLLVSANYFDVLRTPFAAGRGFVSGEDRSPGETPVVVVSHAFWHNHLAGARQAIGSRLLINGHPFTVVGVTGPQFRSLGPAEAAPDVWMPITMQPVVRPMEGEPFRRVPGSIDRWIVLIGRLSTGATAEAARAELTALALRLQEEFPYWSEGSTVHVTQNFAYNPRIRGRLTSLLRLLGGAAGAVLLICCANMALLLLARASARRKEFSVRIALGAGRARVAARLLLESGLLAVAGGVVGLVVALWTARLVAALIPGSLRADFSPNLAVLVFAVGLALLTTLAFGLGPALALSRTDILRDIKEGAPGSGRSWLRHALVAAQVSLSLVLVAGAGLFARSLVRAHEVQLGFETGNRLLVTLNLQDFGYTAETGTAFIRSALERVAAIRGMRAASTMRIVALSGGVSTSGLLAEGATIEVHTNVVGAGYFTTMGIPLLAGRDFTAADDRTGTPVAVVNDKLARRLFGPAGPVGRVVTREDSTRYTVIGVARNAKVDELGEEVPPQIYYPVLQYYRTPVTFVVHTAGPAASGADAIRREIRSLNPNLAIADVRTYDDVMERSFGQYRTLATLVGVFGALALVLATAGLYGLLSYLVANGRREIAIRMALGASGRGLATGVLWRALGLVGAGTAVGVLAVLLLSQLVKAFLFGVEPSDPLTLAGTVAVLVAAAALASYVPARRAGGVDPMTVLRYE